MVLVTVIVIEVIVMSRLHQVRENHPSRRLVPLAVCVLAVRHHLDRILVHCRTTLPPVRVPSRTPFVTIRQCFDRDHHRLSVIVKAKHRLEHVIVHRQHLQVDVRHWPKFAALNDPTILGSESHRVILDLLVFHDRQQLVTCCHVVHQVATISAVQASDHRLAAQALIRVLTVAAAAPAADGHSPVDIHHPQCSAHRSHRSTPLTQVITSSDQRVTRTFFLFLLHGHPSRTHIHRQQHVDRYQPLDQRQDISLDSNSSNNSGRDTTTTPGYTRRSSTNTTTTPSSYRDRDYNSNSSGITSRPDSSTTTTSGYGRDTASSITSNNNSNSLLNSLSHTFSSSTARQSSGLIGSTAVVGGTLTTSMTTPLTAYERRMAAACAITASRDSSSEEEDEDEEEEESDEEATSGDEDDGTAGRGRGSGDQALPAAVAALLSRSEKARRDSVELRTNVSATARAVGSAQTSATNSSTSTSNTLANSSTFLPNNDTYAARRTTVAADDSNQSISLTLDEDQRARASRLTPAAATFATTNTSTNRTEISGSQTITTTTSAVNLRHRDRSGSNSSLLLDKGRRESWHASTNAHALTHLDRIGSDRSLAGLSAHAHAQPG